MRNAPIFRVVLIAVIFSFFIPIDIFSQTYEPTPEKLLCIVVGPQGRLYGKSGRTLYISNDRFESKKVLFNFPDIISGIYCMPDGTLFVATDNDTWDPKKPGRIYRSLDDGTTFALVKDLVCSCALNWSFTSDFWGNLYVGEYGPKGLGISKEVWKTSDRGETWEVIFRAPDTDNTHIHVVAVDPYTDHLWVVNGDGDGYNGIHVSTDYGITWTTVRRNSQPTSVVFTEDAIYWGEDNIDGIVTRYDRGTGEFKAVFTASRHGNYGGSVYAMTCGPSGLIYASMVKYGIYDHIPALWVGKDDTWKPLIHLDVIPDTGQGFTTISEPDANGYIYVTGYRIKDPCSMKIEEANSKQDILMVQNYPNPFNPTTTITYSIVNAGHVTLEVYNILGQKIASLFEGHSKTGSYSIHWDATGQANGIYFTMMKAGGITKTEKMMIVK